MSSLKYLVVVFAALVLAGCSKTQTFEDPVNGIKLTVIGDYWIFSEPPFGRPDITMLFVAASNGPHPFLDNVDRPMCVVSFVPVPDLVGKTQAEINATALEWPDMLIEEMGDGVVIEKSEPFKIGDVAGMETIAVPTGTVTGKERLVFSTLATQRGRATVTCTGNVDTLAQAMPTYRMVRDGVTLP